MNLIDLFQRFQDGSPLNTQRLPDVTEKINLNHDGNMGSAGNPTKITHEVDFDIRFSSTDIIMAHLGDLRRFCRQCQNHRPINGRNEQVIHFAKQVRVWHDDWPRHCGDFQANGLPIPDVGVRWSPDPIERTTKPIKPAET